MTIMNATSIFTPFEFPVQVTIDGRTLDYLLTVDETGHVFEAVPTIFELPLTAQKLILGETDGQLERKIRAYTHLFKYLVPLALVRKLSTYQEVLTPLVEEIERRLQEKGMQWSQLPIGLHNVTLAEQVLNVFGRSQQASPQLKALWTTISAILENIVDWRTSKAVSNMGLAHPTFAADFFPAIIPLRKFEAQKFTFEYLALTKVESVKFYLLEELEIPSCIPYASGILKALEAYGSGDNEIYDAVIRFYERAEGMDEYGLAKLTEVLEHYPTLRSKEIGFEILRLNKRFSARYAAYFLLKLGVSQKEIVEAMMPFFKEADPDISEAAMAIFGNFISAESLPSAAETLDVFIKAAPKKRDLNIALSMCDIAAKNGMYLFIDELSNLLYHELHTVREGTLIFLNHAYKCNGIDFEKFSTPKMAKRFWELTYDPNTDVVLSAIRLLSKIGREQKRKNYIDKLLTVISRNDRNYRIKLEAMEAINNILHQVPYQNQIETVYKMALEEESSLKVLALEGLRFCPDYAFKESLFLKFKNDSDNAVRKAAKSLFELPDAN